MTLCKHDKYKIVTHILAPKWSTSEIRISTDVLTDGIEHYIFQFKEDSPKNKYGWFYLPGSLIKKHPIDRNGGGQVYVVPLSKRQDFTPNKQCEHEEK